MSCVLLLDLVLVCSGAVHWWGGEAGWGGDDVHANAASVLCFSCCFVFCALVGTGGMGAFRIGFCGVFLKFPGSTVPTLDFSHMPAWTSMGGGADDVHASFRSVHWWGGGDGGDVDDVDVVLHDVDCLCGSLHRR